MLKLHNLTLLGTSHIAIESVNSIKSQVKDNKPDIICLELDKNRFFALIKNIKTKPGFKDIKRIGLKGYIFLLIGSYVERKLGQKVGLKPGAEMIEAINQARIHKIDIALIDQDIAVTLRNFSKKLSWIEKWRFVADLLKALFFRKKEMRKLGIDKLDLTKVPEQEVINKMIAQVKDRYPNVYKVLIDDRNRYMAKRIAKIMLENPKKNILAVVGAGHEAEMLNLIKDYLKKQ